jgi:predicted CoA-binding protein
MDLLSRAMLESALNPKSVAIVGASDNPHKVGGRPILFLQRYGFSGSIYPINPGRATVQGLRAYPGIDATPDAPELAIVAIAGEEAVGAVAACAARGVKVAVVMTSGFGETGEAGRAAQARMLDAARAHGMRLIGPNCQGLANFATGMVANFSTIFNEIEAKDGPVAIVSQSGANSQAIYSLLRDKGLYARHVHASLTRAIVERFPATVWLAGSTLVQEAAAAFTRGYPPTRPCLAEYGESFPAFLDKWPEAAHLPYLAQFATIDWHLGRLAIGTDDPPVVLRLDWSLDELMTFFLTGEAPESYTLRREPVALEVRGARGELSLRRCF